MAVRVPGRPRPGKVGFLPNISTPVFGAGGGAITFQKEDDEANKTLGEELLFLAHGLIKWVRMVGLAGGRATTKIWNFKIFQKKGPTRK